jgi:hypothetical protein
VTRERFFELCGLAMAIVAAWLAFAIFASSEFSRRMASAGAAPGWAPVLMYQINAGLVWALFTPAIIAIAERIPIQKPHRLRNAAIILMIAPAFSVIRAAGGGAIQYFGERGGFSTEFVLLSIRLRFHRNFFIFLVVIGIVNLILAQRRAAAREREAFAVRTAITNAEVQRLRSSMQPRLMFATLDAIGALVKTKPEVADQMIIDLARLQRIMVEFSKRQTVTLGEELDVVDRYLELERAHRGRGFTTRIDVEEELLASRIPPLVFQTVIESALSQEQNTNNRRHLGIRGRATQGILKLDVLDDRTGRLPSLLGAEQARAVLRQACGNRAELEFSREGRFIVTTLSMPLDLEQEPA